ncbi:hypothetical protein ES705_28996 [subsurface metagenome]
MKEDMKKAIMGIFEEALADLVFGKVLQDKTRTINIYLERIGDTTFALYIGQNTKIVCDLDLLKDVGE